MDTFLHSVIASAEPFSKTVSQGSGSNGALDWLLLSMNLCSALALPI
jgi:hypothetical protein